MTPFSLEELPKEEAEKLTKELQDVLAKYNAEMGVSSTINLMRRVHPSPIQPEDLHDGKDSTPSY